MARKEHKKHVKDLLAQAIVHKTLDIERNRQVEIKRKLEEIAKLEVVRRVRVSDKYDRCQKIKVFIFTQSFNVIRVSLNVAAILLDFKKYN